MNSKIVQLYAHDDILLALHEDGALSEVRFEHRWEPSPEHKFLGRFAVVTPVNFG